MQFTNLILAACLVLAVNLVESKKLPDFIPQCKKNDPKFDQCVLKAIEAVRPQLNKGIPKIRVPALDPLEIPQLNITRNLPNLDVKAYLSNIKVIGANTFSVSKLKCDTEALALEMTVRLPLISVTCNYDIDGRLLVIPLKGKGEFKGNFTDIIADVKGTGEIVSSKKGVKYVNVKTIRSKIKVGGQQSKVVNTDGDRNNEIITNTAFTFINQNWRQVLQVVTPIVEETADAIIKSMGNNILRAIPYSELLPQ